MVVAVPWHSPATPSTWPARSRSPSAAAASPARTRWSGRWSSTTRASSWDAGRTGRRGSRTPRSWRSPTPVPVARRDALLHARAVLSRRPDRTVRARSGREPASAAPSSPSRTPIPLVAGRGLAYLRHHGVAVAVGVLREAAERLNAPFLTVMRRQRPFVTMKVALSRENCVAGAGGHRLALTGPSADRYIHRERAELDAIGVGIRDGPGRRPPADRARRLPGPSADPGGLRPAAADAADRAADVESRRRADNSGGIGAARRGRAS